MRMLGMSRAQTDKVSQTHRHEELAGDALLRCWKRLLRGACSCCVPGFNLCLVVGLGRVARGGEG